MIHVEPSNSHTWEFGEMLITRTKIELSQLTTYTKPSKKAGVHTNTFMMSRTSTNKTCYLKACPSEFIIRRWIEAQDIRYKERWSYEHQKLAVTTCKHRQASSLSSKTTIFLTSTARRPQVKRRCVGLAALESHPRYSYKLVDV